MLHNHFLERSTQTEVFWRTIEAELVLPVGELILNKGYDRFCYQLLKSVALAYDLKGLMAKLEENLTNLRLTQTKPTEQVIEPLKQPTELDVSTKALSGASLPTQASFVQSTRGIQLQASPKGVNTSNLSAKQTEMSKPKHDLPSLWCRSPKTPQNVPRTDQTEPPVNNFQTIDRKDAFFEMFIKGRVSNPPEANCNQQIPKCPADRSQSGRSSNSLSSHPNQVLSWGKKLGSSPSQTSGAHSLAHRSNTRVVTMPYSQSVKCRQNNKLLRTAAQSVRQTKLPFGRVPVASLVESWADGTLSERGYFGDGVAGGFETSATHGEMINENSMEFTDSTERRSVHSLTAPMKEEPCYPQDYTHSSTLPAMNHYSPQHEKAPRIAVNDESANQERLQPSMDDWMNQIVALGTPVKSPVKLPFGKNRSGRIIDFESSVTEENQQI